MVPGYRAIRHRRTLTTDVEDGFLCVSGADEAEKYKSWEQIAIAEICSMGLQREIHTVDRNSLMVWGPLTA